LTYCTKCGSKLEADVQFCTRCGGHVEVKAQPAASPGGSETSAPVKPGPVAAPPLQSGAVSPRPVAANTKSGCMPTVLVVLGVLALIAVLGIGGLVYAGYKVKQKFTALLHNATPDEAALDDRSHARPGENKPEPGADKPPNDAGGLLDGLSKMLDGGDDEGDPVQPVNDATPVEPCAPAPLPAQSAAKIPLQAGTVVTTAWGLKNGDVENRITINSTTPTSFVEDMATEEYKDDNNHDWKPTDYTDTVCNVDLVSANTYVTVTALHMPHLFHGVTRLRLSDKSFQEAKSTGQLDLRYLDVLPLQEGVKPTYEGGILSRVESQDVAYPMIVNDQPVTLPAIHLTGIMKSVGKDPTPKKDRPFHSEAEVYVIDDPLNPLVLLWKLKDPLFHGGKFRIEVVKIEYKVPHPVNLVEKQLAEQKRAITYGIYFDFNKDTIKPESDPVLKQIVQTLSDHPDWKLTVNGHTDNIGGDAYNLDLSKRRAAAVKQTLVTRFHIAPDRLSTNGYGESGAIDTNDTLEGRARNRRVELTRE
jgi:outer membrane protein OmpA-like peptidoglycan-associated protein